MADQDVTIRRVVLHAEEGALELFLQGREAPPRPDWVREDLWYGGGPEVIRVTLGFAYQAEVPRQTGTGLIGQDSAGENVYMRYTWDGAAWVDPVRVDPNTGDPL